MSKNDTINCPSCGEASTGSLGGADAPTHCEWCGAEYPVPGEDEAPGPSAAGTQDEPNRSDA